jgi:hypothetical protein
MYFIAGPTVMYHIRIFVEVEPQAQAGLQSVFLISVS